VDTGMLLSRPPWVDSTRESRLHSCIPP